MAALVTPRFIAPHFIEVEGAADMPGPVRRACSFTTAAAGWPVNAAGASHQHYCELTSATGRWREGGPVSWRTETRALLVPPELAPPELVEDTAPDLMMAIAAALGVAHGARAQRQEGVALPAAPAPVLCIAPGFVEMMREPGLPGIWCCSQLSAVGEVTPQMPWTHLQTAMIRERRSAAGPGPYLCEVEVLPYRAVMPEVGMAGPRPPRDLMQWSAPSLAQAMQDCLMQMAAPRVPRRNESQPLSGPPQAF